MQPYQTVWHSQRVAFEDLTYFLNAFQRTGWEVHTIISSGIDCTVVVKRITQPHDKENPYVTPGPREVKPEAGKDETARGETVVEPRSTVVRPEGSARKNLPEPRTKKTHSGVPAVRRSSTF